MSEYQRFEALSRMQENHFPQKIIDCFVDGDVLVSNENGTLRSLTEVEKSIVDAFEKKNDATVFHVVYSDLPTESLYFLYITKYEYCWDDDRRDLNVLYPIIWEYDLKEPNRFGFRSIKLKRSPNGGFIRIKQEKGENKE